MNIASPASRLTAVSATLLLHVALIAAVLPHLAGLHKGIIPPKPVTIELLHEQPTTPSAPLPVVPPMPSPPKKRSQLKPHPAPPQPMPQLREPVPSQAKAPEASFDAKPAQSNSTAISAAPAAPASVKTGVSIPASYAASNRTPIYPRLSRQNEEQGTVELRILVKADGSAGAVEIASSSGYPLLDESARSMLKTWRFNPATVDGKAVAEWYRVSIPFKLQN